jgi:hypothetical protein
MNLRILFFILLSFIFSVEIVQAQLHIVKDNLGCTYGLKNKDGNWVIEIRNIMYYLTLSKT